MKRSAARLLALTAPALLTMPLFQNCTVLLPSADGLVVDLRGGLPHLDGDGEDSFFDRLFGYDDDDDDRDDD